MNVMCLCCLSLLFLSTSLSFVWGKDTGVHVTVAQTYLQELIHVIGNGSGITESHIKTFLDKHHSVWSSRDIGKICFQNVSGAIMVDRECLQEACLSPTDVYKLSGLEHGDGTEQLSTLSAILLHQLGNDECINQSYTLMDHHDHHDKTHIPPSSASVWGFGILCTTVINLCSLTGALALPFIHGTMYKGMLIYMVGLAVGTLCGSSLLFLIPEALELTDQVLDQHSYVWKCMTVLMGIYLFFLIERILKIITLRRDKKRQLREQGRKRVHRDSAMSFSSFHKAKDIPEYKKTTSLTEKLPCCTSDSNSSTTEEGGSLSDDQDQDQMMSPGQNRAGADDKQDNISNATRKPLVPKHHHHVAPVAWMIIFGDGLHNFIDGVSIGAAFTESILAGVSVSIAILFEEFPHELGDFAVLLNAGMKLKKALLYNFLSATMCYLGLVVGIFLGENTSTHTWVFAFAGGMFLYISLVDMMPEMNSAAEDPENKDAVGSRNIFLLQNFGLVTGFVLMVVMAIYGGDLEEAIMNS